MLAQNSVWLADLRGTASFVRISGLHDGSVGDSFVWHRAVSDTSDSTVTGADAWCHLNLDIEWIDPGESTCESPARLAPGDSAFFRWESVIIAPPDSSLATARDDWLWPTVLYSREVGTDSLRELPSVHDLDQITRIELFDAQIQGASGAPAAALLSVGHSPSRRDEIPPLSSHLPRPQSDAATSAPAADPLDLRTLESDVHQSSEDCAIAPSDIHRMDTVEGDSRSLRTP